MKKIVYGVAVVPLLVCVASACSSSGTPGSSTTTTTTTATAAGTLRGTYTPAAGSGGAQFSSIAFDDATSTYAYTRAGCTGNGCLSTGTYTFDGVSDLALTDGTTHATEHVAFQAQKTSSIAAAIRAVNSLHPLGGLVNTDAGGSIVSTKDAGPLVTSDGGSLLQSIEQILQALMNGILMALDGGGGSASSTDGGSGSSSSGTSAGTDSGASSTGIPSMSDVDPAGAIAELQAQLNSASLAPYYQDGSRVEGCWANPAGNNLSDIQHAFYCSMPLEFRLCNSIPLLSTDDSQVASRWQSFQQCEARVDGIAGGTGQFMYDAKVSATYYWLFLNKQSGLSAADEATLAASVKPASSGRSFTTLLGSIVSGLATEAANSAWNGLQSLVDEAQTAAAAAGVTIG